ncbi:SDR family oxidoreductase [Nocardioides coralli]|uniref:SDR family oxidoreductase n=1 Tax=Nocardioides coralli TaxID=2872154 RepID=UPI001CA467CE|nr:SDR family oxidoreductase [Nocardioides coralli]QZY30167.1 SDR family oxidoreductase [Nocardioides coralli]
MGRHFITGATSGIGHELARRLHERGDDLVLLARNEERAADLAEAFPGSGVVTADLSELPAELPDGVPDSLDGVVHAAGVVDVASVADSDAASLAETVAVNLVAPMAWTRLLLEPVRRGRGTHVFVNSGSGLRANPHWASYNASKFGLRGFADALRQEEAEHGVRVSSVYPGRTATRMQERVHAQEGKEYDASQWIRPETVAEEIVRLLDLSRDATIPDVTLRPL